MVVDKAKKIETVMMKFLLLLIGLCLSLLGCSQITVVDSVSVVAARDLILSNKSIIIIDGRDSSQFKNGHIPNAINIDAFAENAEKELLKLSPSKTYLVYCTTRKRSDFICDILKNNNFKHIFQMTDGFVEWKSKCFKAEPSY